MRMFSVKLANLNFLAVIITTLVTTFASLANASLIGDTVRFECTNCGPPTTDDFVVLLGSHELTLFNQFEVDVEESSLRINWVFDSSSIISDINFVWSDLDWVGKPGAITNASIDPISTWGTNPALTVAFGDDFVSITNNGDDMVSVGDFLLLNLDVVHVPEPGTFALTVLGFMSLTYRHRQSRTSTYFLRSISSR